jgi:hypothetical protein
MTAYPTAKATTTTANTDPMITALLLFDPPAALGSTSGERGSGVIIWPLYVVVIIVVAVLVRLVEIVAEAVRVGAAVILGVRMGQEAESVQNSPQICTSTTAGGGCGCGCDGGLYGGGGPGTVE